MTDEYMKGYQDGMAVAQDVAESLLAEASSEKAALMRHIDKLEAAVDRLQEENQSIGMAAYELGRKSMADENAKLRDLARHMRDCIGSYGKATGAFGCDSCSRNNDTGECDFDARMRELGVEL
jgi:hypothetical protein